MSTLWLTITHGLTSSSPCPPSVSLVWRTFPFASTSQKVNVSTTQANVDSGSVGLGWDLGACISNKLPGEAAAPGLWLPLWIVRFLTPAWTSHRPPKFNLFHVQLVVSPLSSGAAPLSDTNSHLPST